MYEKPVGYQGGMYLCGMEIEQVFIREPWEIQGITIRNILNNILRKGE